MKKTLKTDRVKIEPIKLRPTPYGWFLLFLLIWVLLAAMVTVNNFLYIIFTLMVGLVVVSHRLGKRNLSSITLFRRFPDEVFAETVFPLDYSLKSDQRPWGSFGLAFEETHLLRKAGPAVVFAQVPAAESVLMTGYFSIDGRGDRQIGPGTLLSTFPFGLARCSRPCGTTNTVLVFPKIQAVEDELPAWLGGMGRGMERADPFGVVPYLFRDYVPGDRYKHIDWKKSARTGALITRVLSDEGAREITIRLPGGASERAISRAASLVVHFGLSGRPVSLEGPGLKTEAGAGREFTRKLLTLLARWNDKPLPKSESGLDRGISVEIDESGEFRWSQSGERHELGRQSVGKQAV
jgi:uncharacterized protein (DUF58 family)